MRHSHVILALILAIATMTSGARAETAAEPFTVRLWEGAAPGALGDTEQDVPTLTVYLPARDADAPTSTSLVVVCPGGGYGMLCSDFEGSEIATWFQARGVAAAVYKYRLPARGYRHPVPMLDGRRALALARARAAEWGVDSQRIGIMGFSAGGHLASTLSTHYTAGDPAAKDPIDRVSNRPDFSILIYPVISMKEPTTHVGSRTNLLGPNPDPALIENLSNDDQVTSDTPPAFLTHAGDDTVVPLANTLNYYQALIKAGVPAEMVIYQQGEHGYGLGRLPKNISTAHWLERAGDWMRTRGLMP